MHQNMPFSGIVKSTKYFAKTTIEKRRMVTSKFNRTHEEEQGNYWNVKKEEAKLLLFSLHS